MKLFPKLARALHLTACLLALPLKAGEPQRVVLVGDSTMATKTGWGDSFGALLKPDASFINFARGGRSSKSYRDEGWWQKALAEKPTWVFIQFGHNDQPGKGAKRETDPKTSFRENLTRYVKEAREAGAKPVLVTSLTRRFFNAEGKIDTARADDLAPYAEGAKAVATELAVPLIDLNAISIERLNAIGPKDALPFDPPKQEGKAADKTHLSPHGAQETAAWVAAEVRRVIPDFAPVLKDAKE